MRRFIVAVALAALLAACPPAQATPRPYIEARCTPGPFEVFSAKVWDLDRWRREKPRARALAAKRRRLECARAGARVAMLAIWRRDRTAFNAHRRAELHRVRVTPFYGGGRWWAIPYPIVVCESGAHYHFNALGFLPYGAYSILDAAWRAWGGKTAHAGEASKREQDRVAHYGYSRYGESPWECKSDGAAHPF